MRRLFTLLMLLALLISPIAAQSSRTPSELTDLASILPDDTQLLLAGRADQGYLETLKGLWPRLKDEVLGYSYFPDYEDVFESGTLGEILGDTTAWRGNTIGIAALNARATHRVMRDFADGFIDGGIIIIISVADRAAAETWLVEELDSPLESRVQGKYTVYTIPNQEFTPAALLSDTHLLITTIDDSTTNFIANDFTPLSSSETFNSTIAQLPLNESGYDVFGYLNAGAILNDLNAEEFITREMTPYRQFRFALANFLGSMAFGGVYSEGQHLILDGTWHYDDASALTELGIDPAKWVTNPIDPTFFITAAQDTQFFLQSTDLQGSYHLFLDTLTILGDMAANSPEIDRMFGIPTTEGANIGGLLRGTLTMGFAGLTGLNLENDVLSLLDDTDFALIASVVEREESPLGFDANLALIARHTGGAETWLPTLAEAAGLYGYPNLAPQPVGSGEALDFGPLIDPMLTSAFGQAAAQDPSLDPMLGVNEVLAAFGTRNAVEHALNTPTDLSTVRIAFPPAFALFLPEPQIIGYINGEALKSVPGWSPTIAHATFSTVASETGMTGRMTITLAAPER